MIPVTSFLEIHRKTMIQERIENMGTGNMKNPCMKIEYKLMYGVMSS